MNSGKDGFLPGGSERERTVCRLEFFALPRYIEFTLNSTIEFRHEIKNEIEREN